MSARLKTEAASSEWQGFPPHRTQAVCAVLLILTGGTDGGGVAQVPRGAKARSQRAEARFQSGKPRRRFLESPF